MSARMPTKMQPRRNPLLTMARYMSDAGADGYTGLTLLYHQTTTQLIIQWTGTDISQSEKLAAEQNLLKLLKGCDVIDSSEDIEPLEFEEGDQEPEMTEDATEMEAINFTEPTSPEFDVKKEPAEITLSSCGKSHTSGGVTVTSYSMAPLGLPTVLAETSSGSGQLSSQEPTTSCGNSLASISQSPGQNLHAGQFTPLSAKDETKEPKVTFKKPSDWISSTTINRIKEAIGGKGSTECQICGYDSAHPHTIRKHANQHFVACFCACGYSSRSRDVVWRHTLRCGNGTTYRVDIANFESWKSAMGLGPNVRFPDLDAPFVRKSHAHRYPSSQSQNSFSVSPDASFAEIHSTSSSFLFGQPTLNAQVDWIDDSLDSDTDKQDSSVSSVTEQSSEAQHNVSCSSEPLLKVAKVDQNSNGD
ncbi:uncharacterized protein [Watersipora subatra]|uniref:uncharacterized protein isoform X3 n=1 Tax=Watersipora subatra TaxID=2589382 RepID=UPI00355C5DD4